MAQVTGARTRILNREHYTNNACKHRLQDSPQFALAVHNTDNRQVSLGIAIRNFLIKPAEDEFRPLDFFTLIQSFIIDWPATVLQLLKAGERYP